MYSRCSGTAAQWKAAIFLVVGVLAGCSAARGAGVVAAVEGLVSDQVLLEQKLDLGYPGLEKVRGAVQAGNLDAARHELAEYYRHRTGKFLPPDLLTARGASPNRSNLLQAVRPLLERTGEYDARLWNGDVFDWPASHVRNRERMYLLGSIGQIYTATADERVSKALVNLMRSFVKTCPPEQQSAFWASMTIGIRMRSGWPEVFLSLLRSPTFTDDDLILCLKSAYQQTDFILQHHSATGNWLTFEMAGLYTSGVVYPEFKDAVHWRQLSCQTAVNDLDAGWLPDGMGIELTPGYGQFFSNYYRIYDLARYTGRLNEFNLSGFVAKTERLYNLYLKIMAPDRMTPSTNDNLPVDVVKILSDALVHFPDRQDFRWIVTGGKEGAQPGFTSVALPYSGFAAMRGGWARTDNMLYFDFGPVGYRHAHQDKLEVMIWAYGRQVLFDPGRSNYADTPHQNYCMDTFSHNTVLVDNRPQRRKWNVSPNPARGPFTKLTNYRWESDDTHDFAAGIYNENYGLAGASDAYPYKPGSNFNQGWGKPAVHYRRVLFYKPDVFVVADTLDSRDGKAHTYDARWHLDSTHVKTGANALYIATADPGQPNLEIIPLLTAGLTVKATSAQDSPQILGWKVLDRSYPATTIQHLKTGPGRIQLLTLLLPLKPGQASLLQSVKPIGEAAFEIALRDGRRFRLDAPPDPAQPLAITALALPHSHTMAR